MFKIPWTEQTIPHVMLEINHECNITCATCYKKFDGSRRTLPELRALAHHRTDEDTLRELLYRFYRRGLIVLQNTR